MTNFLRSILPASSEKCDDHDEYDVEYSFAIEYDGPSLSYDIPQVVPIDVYQIPTAAVLNSGSVLDNLSLPVIQPISDRPRRKQLQEADLGCEVANSLASREHSTELEGFSRVCSCKSVNDALQMGASSLEYGDGCPSKLSHRSGSSGTLGFSDSRNNSNEISGSSDVEELEGDCNDEAIFSYCLGPINMDSDESNLSSPARSCTPVSCEGVEGCADDSACQGNRTSALTFSEIESSDITTEASGDEELYVLPERPVADSNVKKGLCHKCYKGNRFTEKEFCIVCGAKYCGNCVLRAMGSMPEGRKCIPCIGFQIDEARRRSLGKCSRMLKKLLTDWEIKKIMSLEKSCEANQLPPHFVSVNGRPLSLKELLLLQSCPRPPKKLEPGNYWYDKVSGFWGKEGRKPCQVISPQLAIGDTIKRTASNGNTNVLINGREITKKELWMLQLAGIHCEGNPHFWVSADGSYQEEGQRNVMGKIWDKMGIKIVCAALSLPMPPKSANHCGEEVDSNGEIAGSNNVDEKMLSKLLLVGYDQSGTSTIYKQAKIIYHVPFSEFERQNIKSMIQSKLYNYIGILLEGREKFEEECSSKMRRKRFEEPGPSEISDQVDEKNIYSIGPRLKAFSDWLLQIIMAGNLESIFPAATREYAPLIEELWKDKAFQATYQRRNELLMLPRASNYFLDRAVEIAWADYEPSDMDILYAEGITPSKGVASMEFSFSSSPQDSYTEPADQNDLSRRYQLIRVHASSLGENCKWLEMFEDVDLVLYCVSLTDYDEYVEDIDGVCINKMLASKRLFESIVSHPTFRQKDFLLILTKFDLLEEKIEQIPLSKCEWFQDFHPVISLHHRTSTSSNIPPLAQRAFHYIATKFKRLFSNLTGNKLYVTHVTELEADNVDEALKYGREILRWGEEKPAVVSALYWSSESLEASITS